MIGAGFAAAGAAARRAAGPARRGMAYVAPGEREKRLLAPDPHINQYVVDYAQLCAVSAVGVTAATAMIAVIWYPMVEGFYNKWFGWGPEYRKQLEAAKK